MILTKRFECTFEDFDAVIIALAKEIEDGWHVINIENHGFTLSCNTKRDKPEFSVELARKFGK